MLLRYRTILYCTDMGPRAAYTFRHACSLADKLSARIVVLHVCGSENVGPKTGLEVCGGRESLGRELRPGAKRTSWRLRNRIAAACSEIAGKSAAGQIVDKVIVAEGDVQQQILRHISEVGADLVVMGAHADLTLLDALLGDTADKVAKRSPVPVLLVQVPEEKQTLEGNGG